MAYWSDSGVRATSFAGGSGTSSSPYLISTPAQLGYLCYLINSSTSTSYKSKYYKLTADLNMNANYWIPIGYTSTSYAFTGNFDGDGHTISYITINGTYSGCGLFGYAGSSATIKNLKMTKLVITNAESSTPTYVGCILGCSSNTTISNVYLENPCIFDHNTSIHYVGGIVGRVYLSTTISDIWIDNMQMQSAITSARVGGITGWTDSAPLTVNRANIELEVNMVSSGGADYFVGGVVGYNSNTSSNYTIKLTDINIVSLNVRHKTSTSFMGGLIGRLSSNISKSNITIDTICINQCSYTDESNAHDGALVGGSYTCTITKTTNTMLMYNTDNSNITNYSNGLTNDILTNHKSFSSGYNESNGLWLDENGNIVKTYMIVAYEDNWVLYNTTPIVKVPYGPSSAKKVYCLQLVDWNTLYNFGKPDIVDGVLKNIYTTSTTFKLPAPDVYAYLGITLTVTSTDEKTTYVSNAVPGTTVSINGDRKIKVSDLDKTKLISYKKDSSTVVEVENIYYKTSSSTIKIVNDYKYKKDSSTIV